MRLFACLQPSQPAELVSGVAVDIVVQYDSLIGKDQVQMRKGFTLIELLVVIAIM